MISPAEAPLAAPAVRLSSLSAFFPAHNEEENLVPMAAALLSILPAVADEWELVVVDDGSEDATGRLADELAARHPRVRAVHHRTNRGYGAAVRSGLAAARYDYVFFTDGDHQFDVRQIVRLIPALDRADAVVGYRAHRSDPALRRLNAAGWNLLVRRLLGLPVRDVNCAFKLLRREALSGIALEAEGAMVSAELLARLQSRGARIVEVAVDHFPRRHGTPSGARPRVIARAFVELARLYRRVRAGS